jgi:hypothetical protein
MQGQSSHCAATDVGVERKYVRWGIHRWTRAIFSDDQQATIDTMVGDPAQAHKDMVKINR